MLHDESPPSCHHGGPEAIVRTKSCTLPLSRSLPLLGRHAMRQWQEPMPSLEASPYAKRHTTGSFPALGQHATSSSATQPTSTPAAMPAAMTDGSLGNSPQALTKSNGVNDHADDNHVSGLSPPCSRVAAPQKPEGMHSKTAVHSTESLRGIIERIERENINARSAAQHGTIQKGPARIKFLVGGA